MISTVQAVRKSPWTAAGMLKFLEKKMEEEDASRDPQLAATNRRFPWILPITTALFWVCTVTLWPLFVVWKIALLVRGTSNKKPEKEK